ncbi:polysaccharide lyase [Gilvimarinus sp. SDUM040013]|uniref:Polysaccharide lyase n=2 Tax=Gilvimarinus gilvus TaxID=3058038 RepID=A0ABU4RXM0_9GAMM|nr:polysaccharide lyase [Gilvimarinus sp. SDUM040013]MDX6849613.1 polysaccharide lyase [Gilvimarinus sp. SDUM040013]
MLSLVIYGFCTLVASTWAEPWQGDFETEDLSQWHYLANPAGISVQSDCVYQGGYAAEITISGDEQFLWHGNAALNRSELNFKPADTREGTDVYFGWSYYLPKPLSSAKHELGYWESSDSWQQQVRFNIHGEALSFQSSRADEVYWRLPEGASAGVWHDLAMHIHFSSDPTQGHMTIWHDGEKISEQYLQTRVNDTDAMFTQIGILRAREDSTATILIDNARQATDVQTLLAAFDPDRPVTCD